MERVVIIVQARMASTRLPGKVLMDVEGIPMLGRVVERARRTEAADEVVVATSRDHSDEPIVGFCETAGIRCARGSHYDVLDRYYTTAQANKAEIVVRITADCPLIDSHLIGDVVAILKRLRSADNQDNPVGVGGVDLVLNRLPPPWKRTYPIGLDTEACHFTALERAWREAREPAAREHVMPYLYEGLELPSLAGNVATGVSENGFRVALLNHSTDLGSLRWTVDTAEDLEFVRAIYRRFAGGSTFSWLDVLELIETRPDISSINAGVAHKSWDDLDNRAQENGRR